MDSTSIKDPAPCQGDKGVQKKKTKSTEFIILYPIQTAAGEYKNGDPPFLSPFLEIPHTSPSDSLRGTSSSEERRGLRIRRFKDLESSPLRFF